MGEVYRARDRRLDRAAGSRRSSRATPHRFPRRFTSDAAREYDPTWAPDGSRLVFGSTRNGVVDLYIKSSTDTAPESLLWRSRESKNVYDWSPNGRWIVFATRSPATARDLWVLPMDGEKKPVVIASTAAEESNARFSPNSRWIAYQSNESGRSEIYAQAFPGGGGKVQISTAGGSRPQWQGDGKALFYRDAGNRIVSVSVTLNDARVDLGSALAMFSLSPTASYQAAPDGQRFLIDDTSKEPSPIMILLNWRPLR